MNTAAIDVGNNEISPTALIEIIEDLGFDASLLEVEKEPGEADLDTCGPNDLDKDSQRKLMLQVNDADLRLLTSTNTTTILNTLQSFRGVISATFSGFQKNSDYVFFNITIDEGLVGPRALVALLEKSFNVHTTVTSMGGFMMAGRMLKMQQKEQRKHFYRLLIAAVVTGPLLIIAMALPMVMEAKMYLDILIMKGLNVYGLVLFVLASIVQWYSGWAFHRKAFLSMLAGSLGMDFLISSGTIAAYTFSLFGLVQGMVTGKIHNEDVEFFETAAVLIAVVILGKYLECYAKGQTALAIHRLTNLRATRARLVRSGDEGLDDESIIRSEVDDFVTGPSSAGDILIDASLLQKGDIIRLVEGESAPSDGILLTNSMGMDESMLTGESRLMSKKVGDTIFGGSMVIEGSGEMIVTACGDSSTLGRIVSSVQAAQGSKPPIQEVADRIAFYFVPAVAVFSLSTFIVWLVAGAFGVVPQEWFVEKNPNGNYILFAFVFALAVWVSACPCAFGLATPTAILVSTGIAAKLGILVRKGAALQYASEVNTVVFDKTGTLTLGKTTVCDYIVMPTEVREDKWRLLKLLLAAESSSSHPLAKGISDYCTEELNKHEEIETLDSSDVKDSEVDPNFCQLPKIDEGESEDGDHSELNLSGIRIDEVIGLPPNSVGSQLSNMDKRELGSSFYMKSEATQYTTLVVPGQGIKLTISSNPDPTGADEKKAEDDVPDLVVLVGSQDLLNGHGIALTAKEMAIAAGLRVGGKVALFMAVGGVLRVILGVSDMVRPDAAAVVATLKSQGVRCYMVTGDQRATALAIGHVVGIPSSMVFAGAKPEEKEKFIHKLQQGGRKVAFIGDGTNDSPALARANVGFAMAGGTDIAIEAGDIVLCKNDLTSMVTAIHLARKTMQRIRMNYFWALLYNVVLIPVSAGVLYPSNQFALMPMLAAAAMALSSVSIVLSSLLLLLYSPPRLKGANKGSKKAQADPKVAEKPLNGDSISLTIKLCDCPTSLAPILVEEKGCCRKITESFMSGVSYYCDDETLIYSSDPSHTGVRDPENGLYTEDKNLTDVERFLRSDTPVEDFKAVKARRMSPIGSSIFVSCTTPSATSMRRRTVKAVMPQDTGCGCGKENCRCGPQCQCGAPRH
jgi:P-type Cu+ transporter